MSRGSPYDVAVVGAGPAGAVCARVLAEAGARVALVDRMAPPRYKTCGGGLVGRARRELGSLGDPAIERECFAAEVHFADTTPHFRTERPVPIVSIAMRATLDTALVDAAVQVGAEPLAPVEITGCAFDQGGAAQRSRGGP
jgi:flavin-dependent dehydrogenase